MKGAKDYGSRPRKQLELPNVLSRFLLCLTPWQKEPGYRLSSSWHSGDSHVSHKLCLDSSQLLSTTNSSQIISLLMCPTGLQVLGRVGGMYAGRRDAGNAWEPVCWNVMEYLYIGSVKGIPFRHSISSQLCLGQWNSPDRVSLHRFEH